MKALVRKYALPGLLALILAGFSPPLQAQEAPEGSHGPDIFYGLRLGLLAHDVGGLWSRSRAEGGADFNAEFVLRKPSLSLLEGTLMPNLGVSVNSQGGTSKVYGGMLWEFMLANGLFFNSGLGLAIHNGSLESDDPNEKELGSRVLFRVPLELGFTFSERHRISIMFDHVSNAYLANPNEGLDTIGLRYGLQF
jgi:hypothetical protein